MNLPGHVYAFLIGLVGLVGIIVLAATSHPVPQILTVVTVAAVSAGAGLSVPAISTGVATKEGGPQPPA
jgi:hypothetical protein